MKSLEKSYAANIPVRALLYLSFFFVQALLSITVHTLNSRNRLILPMHIDRTLNTVYINMMNYINLPFLGLNHLLISTKTGLN